LKKAIMFDLDGTLINSLPDIAHAMNHALAENELPIHDVDKYRYMVGDGVINLAKRAVCETQDRMEQVLGCYRAYYALNCAVRTHPYDGIRELLHTLRQTGMKVFVFSNKDQQDVETVCAHYFPDFAFDAVRGRVDGVPVKPAPDGALAILRAHGIDPAACWYVGDTNTDMRCGNAACMETIGVTWGFRDEQELIECGAKHIAKAPCDILTIVSEK